MLAVIDTPSQVGPAAMAWAATHVGALRSVGPSRAGGAHLHVERAAAGSTAPVESHRANRCGVPPRGRHGAVLALLRCVSRRAGRTAAPQIASGSRAATAEGSVRRAVRIASANAPARVPGRRARPRPARSHRPIPARVGAVQSAGRFGWVSTRPSPARTLADRTAPVSSRSSSSISTLNATVRKPAPGRRSTSEPDTRP